MKKTYTLFVLLLFSFPLYSQTNNNYWLNYTCGKWVFDIDFEADTVWCATTGGVAKVVPSTGQTVFYNASNSGLNVDMINRIVVDQSHIKWIGTNQGLYNFDGIHWKYFPAGSIYDLEVDHNNKVWFIGTNPVSGNQGLVKYNGSTFVTVTTQNSGLPNNDVTKIGTDSSKNLWLIADYSIVKYDGSTWQVIDSTNTALSGNAQSITVDANSGIWIAAYPVVHFFNGTSWTTFDDSNTPMITGGLADITADDSGNVYIANNSQLLKTDGASWFVFDTSNAVPAADGFFSGAFDQDHNLWAGTANNSLYKYDYSQWIHYNTTSSGLGWYPTEGLVLGKNDEVWLNTLGSFSEKNDTGWSVFSDFPPDFHQMGFMAVDTNNVFWGSLTYGTAPGPIAAVFDGTVWSFPNFNSQGCEDITVDGFNNKWFATYDGLVKYDGSTWTVFNMANSPLADDFVYRVYADKHNNIWVSTPYGALQKFDGISNWQTFNLTSIGLGSVSAGNITEDLQGNIFVSSGGGGGPAHKIAKYDGSTWTVLPPLPADYVGAMEFDHYNNLWVTFINQGLGKYDGTDWVIYDIYNSGLPDMYGYDLAVDRYDNIWISTVYGGAAVFNERELNFTTPVPDRVSVSGRCFFDADSNGVKDVNEPYLNNQKIEETLTNYTTFTNSQGEYKFFLAGGNYNITPQLNPGWHVSTDSLSYNISVDSSNLSGFDFGVTASPYSRYEVNLYSGINRCDFVVPYWLHYTNTGSQLDSGYIEFTADTSCSFVSSIPPPDAVNNNIFRWNFPQIVPFSDQNIFINLHIPNSPGDSIHHSATLYYYDASVPVPGAAAFINDEILCAADPNDKTVVPAGVTSQHYTLIGDTLDYIIRFQNLGNDTAFFVKVVDSLDVNLDPQSVRIISASHSYYMTHENGVLAFDFPVCNLPPAASNPSASCGYVHFSAKPYSSISSNTVIRNKASIFFNFNESVLTNEVFNTMVDSILTDHSMAPANEGLRIIPNPFNEQTRILYPNTDHSLFHVSVKNTMGQALMNFDSDMPEITITGKELGHGIFIIEIFSMKKKYYSKLVVD